MKRNINLWVALIWLLLVAARPSIAESENSGQLISLDFQQAPTRMVLQQLAKLANKNIIIDDDVSGNVSIKLTKVSWQQALTSLLINQKLASFNDHGVIIVGTTETIKSLADNQKMMVETQPQTSMHHFRYQLKYGQAEQYYKIINNNKNHLLSKHGSVIADQRTNQILIDDTEANIQRVQRYIKATDIRVKQVEIEARIVTIDKSYERQIGIKWDTIGNPASAGGRSIGRGFSVDFGAKDIGNLKPGKLALATLSKDLLIGLELSAIEAEGKGEIISSPKLLTADQQEALIEQGTEIPYNESTSSGAAAIAFKQAVLRLRVTPQISPHQKVMLKLEVNQDAKSKETAGSDTPIIDTRHILTNVVVNNGQTVVLGGIYERSKSNSETRVPFLSQLPLVGNLFKQKSFTEDRKELLIFVTPTIIDDGIE